MRGLMAGQHIWALRAGEEYVVGGGFDGLAGVVGEVGGEGGCAAEVGVGEGGGAVEGALAEGGEGGAGCGACGCGGGGGQGGGHGAFALDVGHCVGMVVGDRNLIWREGLMEGLYHYEYC